MLSQVYIKKYLYIEDITLEFCKGLNVFTGETGVGKSLIIDAIEFVLGKKGSYEDGTYVEIVFDNVENEFSEDGTLILARQIKNSKSIYYINGRRATRTAVEEASENIIEIHTQYHQQNLFKKSFYREVLDRYASLEGLLDEYQRLFSKYKELKEKEREILEKQSERIRELDIIRFQLAELEEADIKVGEKEELEKRYRYLSEIQNIKEVVYLSKNLLEDEENSILDNLNTVLRNIQKIKDAAPSLEEIYKSLEEAKILLQEASYSLSDMDLEFDENEILEIEERLNLINKLELKYNTDEEGLLKIKEEFKEKIDYLENLEFEIPKLQQQIEEIEGRLHTLAEKISAIRDQKSKELSKEIEEHLKQLGLKEAQFVVEIEEKEELDRFGKDNIIFLFSANRGYYPSLLGDVASGGEISRISLALKLTTGSNIESMIFDEIDTGLGGKTAVLLAEKLKKLSKDYQIILITHLPQIAAYADKHFYIDKAFIDEKTKAIIKVLDRETRKEEIARMLTGKINQETLNLAEKLIESTKLDK